jgi:hypothetical protein
MAEQEPLGTALVRPRDVDANGNPTPQLLIDLQRAADMLRGDAVDAIDMAVNDYLRDHPAPPQRPRRRALQWPVQHGGLHDPLDQPGGGEMTLGWRFNVNGTGNRDEYENAVRFYLGGLDAPGARAMVEEVADLAARQLKETLIEYMGEQITLAEARANNELPEEQQGHRVNFGADVLRNANHLFATTTMTREEAERHFRTAERNIQGQRFDFVALDERERPRTIRDAFDI